MQSKEQPTESLEEMEKVQADGIVIRMTGYCEKTFKKAAKRNGALERETNEILRFLQKRPEMGSELGCYLSGFRVIHSHDNQFRIVYQYDRLRKEVTVHAIGHRSNVYEELTRYLKASASQRYWVNEIPVSKVTAVA